MDDLVLWLFCALQELLVVRLSCVVKRKVFAVIVSWFLVKIAVRCCDFAAVRWFCLGNYGWVVGYRRGETSFNVLYYRIMGALGMAGFPAGISSSILRWRYCYIRLYLRLVSETQWMIQFYGRSALYKLGNKLWLNCCSVWDSFLRGFLMLEDFIQ